MLGFRRVGHWLVCLLMACIPLQGMAMVMERIQGAAHVHVGAAKSPRPRLEPTSPADLVLLSAVRDLRHSHGAARHLWDVDAVTGQASTTVVPVAHHHDLVGHHLHEPDDPTVLRVDDPAADADTAAGTASKRVLLDVDTPPMVLAAATDEDLSKTSRPTTENSPPTPSGRRLERPPRHSQR